MRYSLKCELKLLIHVSAYRCVHAQDHTEISLLYYYLHGNARTGCVASRSVLSRYFILKYDSAITYFLRSY